MNFNLRPEIQNLFNNIRVVITTMQRDSSPLLAYFDRPTGTDNPIYINFYRDNETFKFLLNNRRRNDFESGNRDVFNISDNILRKADMNNFSIELKPTRFNGIDDWMLGSVQIYFNNELVFSANPEVWLTRDNLLWYSRRPLNVFVEITTGQDAWSGTDNDIYINFYDPFNNKKSYKLDDSGHNDFERGSRYIYRIYDRNLNVDDLNKFSLEIKRNAFGVDRWKLASVKIYLNGRVIHRADPNVWLDSNNTLWKNF